MAGAKPQVKVAFPVRFMMFWVRHLQQCIASLGELWRTPASSMLTLAVIGVCLALPASFYLATKNVQQLTAYWKSDAQISLFLKQNVTEQQRDLLQKNYIQHAASGRGRAGYQATGLGRVSSQQRL
ncbi:cell division protein FtsX [Agarivorans albus MKT 106]|uniref:Cell division protein FtsX n=1 Tax=Agarivorans albus MKT 106 TaxID=1331007 RepID=R9PTJ0_AGAAL|nr:hypothetical protein [Agarivorans albus]GAD02506.1 cell division protein FtsX [Agarivorans albus MKT 106]